MPTTNSGPTGSAVTDLGMNLQAQLKDETDEQRKKRLQMAQTRLAMGPAAQTLGLGGYGGG